MCMINMKQYNQKQENNQFFILEVKLATYCTTTMQTSDAVWVSVA